MKTRTLVPIIVAILLTTAAIYVGVTRESAEEKARRLRATMEWECTWAGLDNKSAPGATRTADQQARCDVARREYNKFIN